MACVIVLGCFRSGTSAVAGVLHHLGVHMGEVFDPPNENNPTGFWEDVAFKQCHKWLDQGSPVEHIYENLIRSREERYALWGIKDPLLCIHISTLTSYLRPGHKLILCRRPLAQIARSMNKAVGHNPPEDMFSTVANHYLAKMEESLRSYKGPIHEVQFAEINSCVPGIAQFVGVPVTQAAVDFVNGHLA